MPITAVSIQNFRSIAAFKSPVKALNIFVGQNDEGKSNILRALDLFFNHDKKTGIDLVWERDFCRFAPARGHHAPEISIELEIMPPVSFANCGPVLWRRVWRRDGFHSERIRRRDGSELSAKSKVRSFLRSMRFDYVPAIKAPDYFQSLLRSLHDMLEATVEDEVRQASHAFTAAINKNTRSILDEIKHRLSLDTTIELPSDLRDLFAQLEFTSATGKHAFSLSQRGDGVKVRHVPIVLRWLAEQANHRSAPGKPKVVTVWGYEEPENNLELRRCFDLAREFVSGCETIQTFVTTHSPAFYSICREGDSARIQLFSVERVGDPPATSIRQLDGGGVSDLDSSMGLMDFIEPYLREASAELERVRAAKAKLRDLDVPTLYCEGPIDKRLLEEALQVFHPSLAGKLAIPDPPGDGAGHNWVREAMIAWAHSRPTAKCVGLFDCDAEAQKTRSSTNAGLHPNRHAIGVDLQPCDALIPCFKAGFRVPFAIEELLGTAVWDQAEKKGWLEERPKQLATYGFDMVDTAFADYLSETVADSGARRLIRFRVSADHKNRLCVFVTKLDATRKAAALEGLKPSLDKCLKSLGLLP
jgi:hypothetical protein